MINSILSDEEGRYISPLAASFSLHSSLDGQLRLGLRFSVGGQHWSLPLTGLEAGGKVEVKVLWHLKGGNKLFALVTFDPLFILTYIRRFLSNCHRF